MKDKKNAAKSSRILDSLNQSLQLEYSLVIHYPRIASAIKDEKTREMALALGTASIKHADTVASAISTLGGNPQWSFESYPTEMSIVEIFQKQLEKEKIALQLHQQNTEMCEDISLRHKFSELAREETSHIEIVKNILSRLESP